LLNSTSKPSLLGAFYTTLQLHIAKSYEILESNYSEESMEIQNKKAVCFWVCETERERGEREREWMSV